MKTIKLFVLMVLLVAISHIILFQLKMAPPMSVLDIPAYTKTFRPDNDGIIILNPSDYESNEIPERLTIRAIPDSVDKIYHNDEEIKRSSGDSHFWLVKVKDGKLPQKFMLSDKNVEIKVGSWKK